MDFSSLNPEELKHKINELEKKMFEHAHQLEFEEAAHLRDVVQSLRKNTLAL